MEEPGRLQSMGSLRVGHDWATSLSLFTFMHWRRKWQPTPAFLPGESQGGRSLVGRSPWGPSESDKTEWLYFRFSLSCIGEGNGNPLQCSCLENPRDGGAWWAAVYGVAWMGEPGGLPSMGSHRVGHGWSDLAAAAAYWGRITCPWFQHQYTRAPILESVKLSFFLRGLGMKSLLLPCDFSVTPNIIDNNNIQLRLFLLMWGTREPFISIYI